MKKFLLLASVFLATLATAQSSFQVLDPNTNMTAYSHYYFWVGASDPTVTLEFPVTNVSANSVQARVKKTVYQNPAGQDIYFCFGINCYTPSTFDSGIENLGPGQSLPYTQQGITHYGIRTDFDANGVLGLSVVRYTIYDAQNPNDSVNITISYNVTANGIHNTANSVLVSNASPNPASTAVSFNYDLNGAAHATLKIYNSLGNVVKTVSLTPNAKSAQVDVSALAEGFYFYSVICDGKAVSTRRLVITR
jgi:hypothetical protein